MLKCIQQETCPQFKNGHKVRDHYSRMTDKCLKWDGSNCTEGYGASCDIAKIRRLKKK